MAPGQNGNLHHTGPRSEIKKTIKSSKLKKKKVFKGLIRKGSFRLTQSKKKASEKKQNSKWKAIREVKQGRKIEDL